MLLSSRLLSFFPAASFFTEAIFSDGRMFTFGISSKVTPTAHREVQAPQWVQASSSIICLVAILTGSDESFAITALDRRLIGLAMI